MSLLHIFLGAAGFAVVAGEGYPEPLDAASVGAAQAAALGRPVSSSTAQRRTAAGRGR